MSGGITQALGACLSPDPSPCRLSGLVQCTAVSKDPVSFMENAEKWVTWRRPRSLLVIQLLLLLRARQSCGRIPAPLEDGPWSLPPAVLVGVLGARVQVTQRTCLPPAWGWVPSRGSRGESLLPLAGFGSRCPPLAHGRVSAASACTWPSLCLSVSNLFLSCFVRTLVIGFGAHVDNLDLLIS